MNPLFIYVAMYWWLAFTPPSNTPKESRHGNNTSA